MINHRCTFTFKFQSYLQLHLVKHLQTQNLQPLGALTTMPWWRENSNYCFLWHNEFWVVRIVPTFLFIQLLNMHSSYLLVPTYMIDNKHDRHVHIPWYSVELIQCSTVNISDAFNEDSDYFFLLINENVFFVCKRYAC